MTTPPEARAATPSSTRPSTARAGPAPTFLFWEALRHLRQESETETQPRQARGTPVTDPPYDLSRLVGDVRVLEDGMRRAMDDVQAFHRGGEGGVLSFLGLVSPPSHYTPKKGAVDGPDGCGG